jgi:dsRNA-specific ribonuclease
VLEKNSTIFKGVGKTRRSAEQQAAQAALLHLQALNMQAQQSSKQAVKKHD